MKTKIQTAIATKNEVEFKTELSAYVHDFVEGLDQWTVSQLIKEIQSQRPGKKGRLASPFTEEKVNKGGKRGRPALTNEEKVARLKEKFEKEMAEIKANTNYREYTQEELDEINKVG